MPQLDRTRNLELGNGVEDGDGGEDVVRVETRIEQVAAKGGGTPWSTGTKLEGRD